MQGALALDADTIALFHPDGVTLIEPATGAVAWLDGAQAVAAPAIAGGRIAFASGSVVTIGAPSRVRARDDAQPGAIGPAEPVGDRALWRFADRLELRDATGALARTIAFAGLLVGVDDTRLAAASADGVVAVVDGADAPRVLGVVTDRVRALVPTATGALVATATDALHLPPAAPCPGLALALDARRATALVVRDGALVHCALVAGTATSLGPASPAVRAAFSADGTRLVVIDGDRLRLFDERDRVLADRRLAAAPTTFNLAADGHRVALATATGVAVLDPIADRAIAGPAAPDVPRLALSADGRLAAAFVGGRLVAWPSDAPQLARDLGRTLPTPAPTLVFVDDTLLAIGERTVSRWSLALPTAAALRAAIDALPR